MRFLLFFSLLILTCTFANAQAPRNNTGSNRNVTPNKNVPKKTSHRTVNKMIDLSLKAGVPMEDFQKSTSSIPFGGKFALLFQPNRDYFVFAGFDVGGMQMASRTENVNIPVVISAGNTVIDQFNIPLKFTISSNITTAHFVLRVSSPTDLVKIYGEGAIGFNYFNTKTSVYDESEKRYLSSAENNLIYDKSQLSDFTYSMGGGAGLLFKLGKYTNLNIKGSYMFGGPAKYFDKNDIKYWDINVSIPTTTTYDPNNKDLTDAKVDIGSVPKVSRTDMLIINVGLNIYLN